MSSVKEYMLKLSCYQGDVTMETKYLFTQIQSLTRLNKEEKEKERAVLLEVLKSRALPYAENKFLTEQLEDI